MTSEVISGGLDDPLLALSQSLTSISSSFIEWGSHQHLQQLHLSPPSELNFQASTSEPYHLMTMHPQAPLEASLPVDSNSLDVFTNYNLHLSTFNPFKAEFSSPPESKALQLTPPTPCDYCERSILEKTYVLIENKCFHEACARCVECSCQLDDKCYFREGMLYCRDDYVQRFTRQCERCQSHIDTQTLVMNVRDVVFHLHCFSCVVCGEMLRQGEKFALGPSGNLTCYLHMDPYLLQQASVQDSSQPLSVLEDPGTVKSRTTNRTLTTSKSDSQDEDRDSSPERSGNSQKTKRMRTSFKHHQLREMKRYFQLNHNPDAKDLKGLAQKTGLTKRVLQVWFQNARAKYRRSQHNNPDSCMSPNGCILPQVKLEQCYPGAGSASLSDGSRTSISPFDGHNTNSSYSRSMSPETRRFEEQSALILV